MLSRTLAVSIATLLYCNSVAGRSPNVLLILADDYGWANIGYHNPANPEVVTPHLDALAEEGIKLDRHYTYKFCAPSRASFQTGRLPVHVNVLNTDPTSYNKKDKLGGYAGIPLNMTTVADKLASANYTNHFTGKWDVGMATLGHTPLHRGYDSFLGYFHHANDYYSQKVPIEASGMDVCLNAYRDLWENHAPAVTMKDTTVYEEEYFLNSTVKFLKEMGKKPDTPFFLMHSFHLVHYPLEVPAAYENQFDFITDSSKQRKPYSAMTKYMDDTVHSIITELKDQNLWDNTLIIFMSDNGGPIYNPCGANNWPLKGGKESDWEGGVRTNAFVSGGFIPEAKRNTTNQNLIHIADWYATLSALAGVDAHDPIAERAGLPAVDGKNIWQDLVSSPATPARTQIHLSELALIDGQYKVVLGNQYMSGWTPKIFPRDGYPQPEYKAVPWDHWAQDCTAGCLFNIFADPNERDELSMQHPDVLAEMLAKLAELNKANYNPDRGEMDIKACLVAEEKYGGYYGPFVDL